MRKNIKEISLFISCPHDIKDEIKYIKKIVEAWNRNNGSIHKIILKIIHWKTDAYPEVGKRPQDIINKQIFDKSDIVVGVFWTHFGTSTGSFQSGTEEEIRRAISMGKYVMLYFSARKIKPSQINKEQFERVNNFKEEFKDTSIYAEYISMKEFEKLFNNHLSSMMNDKFILQMKPKTKVIINEAIELSKLNKNQLSQLMENIPDKKYVKLEILENLIKQNFSKNFENIFGTAVYKELKKNSSLIFKKDKKLEIQNIKDTLKAWETQILADCKSFQQKFNLETFDLYKNELSTLRSEIFAKIPWTVNAALKTPDQELIRYRAAFANTSGKEIFDVVKKVLTAAKNYHDKMKLDYSKLKNPSELKFKNINSEKLLLPGVIGLGIRSEILYRLYPDNFSIMTRRSIWGMYFLSGENLDFIKFEKNRDGKFRISHDWEYDYERFTFLSNLISNILEEELEDYGLKLNTNFRFAYVANFLNNISKNNENIIDELIEWKK